MCVFLHGHFIISNSKLQGTNSGGLDLSQPTPVISYEQIDPVQWDDLPDLSTLKLDQDQSIGDTAQVNIN